MLDLDKVLDQSKSEVIAKGQREKKMYCWIATWGASGTAMDIITSRFWDFTPKNYESYCLATYRLASKGLIANCGGFFHKLETTCEACA
jgi:hypothetical protein